MARRTAVLAALISVTFALSACGGSAKVSGTTETTLTPKTLETPLAQVETFFNSQGGGNGKEGPLMTGGFATGPFFNYVGSARSDNTCPTAITGPRGETAVSLITVRCSTARPPNPTFQQAVALFVTAVRKFAPAGVAWTETALGTNATSTHKKTFGNAVLQIDIAPAQQTVDLNIKANGF